MHGWVCHAVTLLCCDAGVELCCAEYDASKHYAKAVHRLASPAQTVGSTCLHSVHNLYGALYYLLPIIT